MINPEQPQVLYHASSLSDVELFEPRNETSCDPTEGPLVFATPYRAYASLFIAKTEDTWSMKGGFINGDTGEAGNWYMIINGKDQFLEIDRGGAIYELSPSFFSYDPTKNMGNIEWTSSNPVRPIGKTIYGSGLAAMLSLGVKVCFVAPNEFDTIRSQGPPDQSLIESLEGEERLQ